MTAISDKIRSVDQVFVVGHKNSRYGCFGSAVGMQLFASNVLKIVMSFMTQNICLRISNELFHS